MGSGEGQPESPETPDFFRGSGDGIRRFFVDDLAGPGPFGIGSAIYYRQALEREAFTDCGSCGSRRGHPNHKRAKGNTAGTETV
jgi:hypothetical protein